jgi:hypothetical protein
VALADFPGKFMELGSVVSDISLNGWFGFRRIHSEHPNLVNQALLEFFALCGGEEL